MPASPADILFQRLGAESTDGHRGSIGGGVDGKPHQNDSSPRRAGSDTCNSRNRRLGDGIQSPARSGHSIRMASPSDTRLSQSRSAASSAERKRKQSR